MNNRRTLSQQLSPIFMQACFNTPGSQMARACSLVRQSGGLRLAVLLMVLGPLLTGCFEMPKINNHALIGPFFTPKNHAGDKALPASVHRVLILPVYGGQVAEVDAALALDEVLLGALQKQARFEVVALSREDCQRRFNRPEVSSTALLPSGFMDELAKAYGVDAVLFIDLTIYQPYGSLAVGFRAKLATTQDVRLIWSFDDGFSLADPAVVNSAARFSRNSGASLVPIDMTLGTMQSPRRFAAYAAEAMFETLPPR
jgi:hypothetical protein